MPHRWTSLAVCLLLAGNIGLARAQTTPAPVVHPDTLQSPQQRAERYYDQRRDPQEPAPVEDPVKEPSAPEQPQPANSTVRFLLQDVQFDESAFLQQSAMEDVAAPFLGREVGMDDLQSMIAGINALYETRKITTARAILSDQAIENGVVHVDLVEGRLGELTIQGNDHTREHFIRERIHQQSGEVVETDALREDLVYLNRTTSLQIQALLRPGTSRGQTDILLQATEPPRRSLDFFVDNAGVDSTGSTRIGLQGHMYGLIGVGDMLDASLAHAKGGNDGSLSYSAIVNQRNGRLGLSYSQSQINIINGAFRDLDITGRSSGLALEYNQPFVATQHWTVNGVAAYSSRRSVTEISGLEVADTRSQAISLGVSFGRRSARQQWAMTQVVTSIHSKEPLSDRSSFVIASGNIAGIRRLGESRYSLRLDAGWQFSSGEELPSANLFQIGGIGSVRGYQRGILSGPRGYYLDLELHRPIGQSTDAYAFIDHGAVRGAFPKSASITGAGVGVVYRYKSWLIVSADVAHAFDSDVIPEQDSSRVDLRFTVHWE